MFDIGFIEMLVIGLILLLVVGPERLPEVARTVGGWVHQAKQYMDSMKSELDRDLQLSELDQQTRRATETGSSLDDPGGRSDRDSSQASGQGEGGEGRQAPAEAGEDRAGSPAQEASGEGEAVAAADDGETAPDQEDQAASDMERELQDDDQRDDHHRG